MTLKKHYIFLIPVLFLACKNSDVKTADDTPIPDNTTSKSTTMQSKFIFDQENIEKNVSDLSAIYNKMGKYYEGVEKADLSILEEVFHDTWYMRDTDTPDEANLNVENKQTFIKRVKDHGPYKDYAADRLFVNVGTVYNNLAFVRINKDPSRNATSFFFFKLQDGWTIMDKLWVIPRKEYTGYTKRQSNYMAIEQLLQDYFMAIYNADHDYLNHILHEDWDSKQVDDKGDLLIKSKADFLDNLGGEYIDYSQLTTIDIYHGKLAIVRIDQTSKSTTSFIIIFKIDREWQIACERKAKLW